MRSSVRVLVLAAVLATLSASCAPTQPQPAVSPGVGQVVKIATHTPLTGDRAQLGAGIRNGVRLAVEQKGDRLRGLGLPVEVVAYDDRASARAARANAEQLVADPDILLVVGHLTSNAALAAVDVYREAGLAMISPANSDPALTAGDYPNVVRIVGRDDGQGAAAAEFAATDLRARSAYILHDGTGAGQMVAAAFRQQAERREVQVVGEIALTEVGPAVDALAAARPAVVFLALTFDRSGPLLREARTRKVSTVFLGPDWLDAPALAQAARDAVVGLHYVTVAGPPAFYPGADTFERDYRRRFGDAPPPFALQGFDAAGIGLEAMATAARAAGGRPSRAQIAGAVRGIRGYAGLSGPIAFDGHGDLKEAVYFVVRVTSPNPAAWEQRTVARALRMPPPTR